ncbi:MAG: conjugative transposon protein TraM [Sediminibacterium sp.]
MNKQLKFYLFLPVLAIPFVTMAFALMDGGNIKTNQFTQRSGMNMQLPDAQISQDSPKDKMSFYAQAISDSVRHEQQLKNDPYITHVESETVEEKILAIQERIRQPQRISPPPVRDEQPQYIAPLATTQQRSADPDLEAINQTIEKLAALQRPAVYEASKETGKHKPAVYAVQPANSSEENYFGKTRLNHVNRFYEEQSVSSSSGSMTATISVTQVLQTGSVVKMALNNPITIAGRLMPAGSMVYGTAAIENERLLIRVPSIRAQDEIMPVDLGVYDLDGMEGIYVPGSISRDVLKSTAEQSMQSMNILSLDRSIKTQAAIAGIGTVKNMLGKKVKAVRVRVSAGYLVFLRDNHLK